MGERRYTHLNRLDRELPEGLLVDAAWLAKNGYSRPLLAKYVRTDRLEQPTRSVYRRPRGTLTWQQVVVSLQTLLARRLAVGGRTALDLHGFAHYLPQSMQEVHLHGDVAPPAWLAKLPIGVKFQFHNTRRLFPAAPLPSLPANALNAPTVMPVVETEALGFALDATSVLAKIVPTP